MIAALVAAAALAALPSERFTFVAAAPLAFRDVSGDDDQFAILEQNGQGLCVLDFDGDGRMDLYLVNGSTRARWREGAGGASGLFRNRGDRRFEDASVRAGAPGPAWGTGCAAADFDADGRTDLLVLGWRDSRLYRNLGEGRFEDATKSSGLAIPGWASSSAFADLDADGALDVVVSRYVDFDFARMPLVDERAKPCAYRGVRTGCPPLAHPPQSTIAFLQSEPGRFRRVPADGGLAAVPTRGFGVVALPLFASAGRPDVYVACDQMENRLFVNRLVPGAALFEERGLATGAAVNAAGRAESGMGLAVGDVWEDGRPDLLLTNFAAEKDTLYRNLGDSFVDATIGSGIEANAADLGWGNALADLDGDSHLDAIVANGHIYPQVEALGDPADRYAQPVRLYAGDGAGRFREAFPPALAERRSRRGLVVADLDDDGRLDVVTQTHRGAPQIFWNDTALGRHWIRFRLVAAPGAPALAARVTVELEDGSRRTAWHAPNQGFQSSQDPRVFFGLAGATAIGSVEVSWPGGSVEKHGLLGADREYVLERGRRLP